jgi:hypothetical protein
MNSEEIAQFRNFVRQTMEAGREVTGMSHVAEPVKAVVRDFIKISENINLFIDSQTGQSADVRVLKKKMDQMRSEGFVNEKKIEKIQLLILDFLEGMQEITLAAETIIKSNQIPSNSIAAKSIQKIQLTIEEQNKKIMDFSSK